MSTPEAFSPEAELFLDSCESPHTLARALDGRESKRLGLLLKANQRIIRSNKIRALAVYCIGLTLGALSGKSMALVYLCLFLIVILMLLSRRKKDRAINQAIKSRISTLRKLGLINVSLSQHHDKEIEQMESALGLRPLPAHERGS
ncbi:hypothetical protein [Synechococcus sp. UW140]|uniref:hypothetical protein n=1 Tax=Synechococcus sp. UW140 TaxID=368503 RepID=UPI000E0E81DD|nr:hypothetical protein [Synechococcus sp. UW140]